MKVIENRTDSVLVTTTYGGWTLIAKHEDENGEYFLNEKLKKQYIGDTEHVEHPIVVAEEQRKQREELRKQDEAYINRSPEKHTYTFDVTTANKYGEPHRYYTKEIKAFTVEEAEEKLNNHYKRLLDVILVKFDDLDPHQFDNNLV